jgi:hypothetical protein
LTVVWMLLVVGAVLVGVGVVVRIYGLPFRETSESGTHDRPAADGEATASADAVGNGAVGGPDSDGADSSAPPVKTDEQRIVEILSAHDGRIYQRELVDRTEWSASKVSRLLSTMEDEGRIEKIRIGRENVVTLPDADAADETAESPDADLDDANPDDTT